METEMVDTGDKVPKTQKLNINIEPYVGVLSDVFVMDSAIPRQKTLYIHTIKFWREINQPNASFVSKNEVHFSGIFVGLQSEDKYFY